MKISLSIIFLVLGALANAQESYVNLERILAETTNVKVATANNQKIHAEQMGELEALKKSYLAAIADLKKKSVQLESENARLTKANEIFVKRANNNAESAQAFEHFLDVLVCEIFADEIAKNALSKNEISSFEFKKDYDGADIVVKHRKVLQLLELLAEQNSKVENVNSKFTTGLWVRASADNADKNAKIEIFESGIGKIR